MTYFKFCVVIFGFLKYCHNKQGNFCVVGVAAGIIIIIIITKEIIEKK